MARKKRAPKRERKRTAPGSPGKGEGVPARPHAIAAIDVGTTSIRMKIVEARPDGTIQTLEDLVHPVSTGVDTFRLGRVTPDTMRAIARVLENFARVFREYGVERVRAVATSGIRDASNQDMLVDRIRHESGITLQVLDPVEESRLTYQVLLPFLQAHLTDPNRHTMLFDLGGGSTEIMVLRGEDLVFANSRRLGTNRLLQSTLDAECVDTQSLLESIIRNILNSMLDLYRAYPITQCVIINPLLTQALRSVPGARALPGGMAIPSAATVQAIQEATALPPDRLAQRFALSQSDAELGLPAFLILQQILEHIHVDPLYFAECDLMGGILHELLMELRGENPLDVFGKQIIRSAIGVAERYQYNADHSLHVADLADQLFAALARYLDLGAKDRLYLEAGAILHDIGMFVSERAHHKHSAYLARWSEIIGLSEEEQNLVSLLARYHRKSTPKPQHIEFMSLPAPERLRVSKLASLLRIADALDRGHRQAVRKLHVEIRDNALALRAESTSDLAVEIQALGGKADLFEEITGLKVTLRRHLP